MRSKYKSNWEETRERYLIWWNRKQTDRPLLAVQSPKKDIASINANKDLDPLRWPYPVYGNEDPALMEQRYTDIDWVLDIAENQFKKTEFLYEAYPGMFAHFGPAGVAAFLGSKLTFASDTVWANPCFNDIRKAELKLDRDGRWWKWSTESTKAAVDRASGNFCVGIPDLVENLDQLAALLGTQELLCYLLDEPGEVHRLQKQLLPIVLESYGAHYDIITDETGWSEAAGVIGPGKVARVQCDFSCMISPDMFDEFALPYLKEQCDWYDYVYYHLDGPGAICHLDSLLKIESLDAVQFVPGALNGGDPHWYYLYEKVLNAGKGVWAIMKLEYIKDFVKRFGGAGVKISANMGSVRSYDEADEILSDIIKK